MREVDTVGIKLTDDRNNPIDLNGLNFQLGILIQFIPKGTRINTNLSRQQIDNQINSNQKDYQDSIKRTVRPRNKNIRVL